MSSLSDKNNRSPSILLISLSSSGNARKYSKDLHKAFEANHVNTNVVKDAKTAINHLSAKKKPQAILVTDPAIIRRTNSHVLDNVLSYASEGGRVIFCCHFLCNNIYDAGPPPKKFKRFFKNRLEVPWKITIDGHSTPYANPLFAHGDQVYTNISDGFDNDGICLENVEVGDAMYLEAGLSKSIWTPAAFKSFSKGWVGIVGLVEDTNCNAEIILSL
ncbi:hypothetical protein MW887_007435 [Aspergillus wentii]|nr:hypothetical protein MW887_007435 [Aspergillus wentii]